MSTSLERHELDANLILGSTACPFTLVLKDAVMDPDSTHVPLNVKRGGLEAFVCPWLCHAGLNRFDGVR